MHDNLLVTVFQTTVFKSKYGKREKEWEIRKERIRCLPYREEDEGKKVEVKKRGKLGTLVHIGKCALVKERVLDIVWLKSNQ